MLKLLLVNNLEPPNEFISDAFANVKSTLELVIETVAPSSIVSDDPGKNKKSVFDSVKLAPDFILISISPIGIGTDVFASIVTENAEIEIDTFVVPSTQEPSISNISL